MALSAQKQRRQALQGRSPEALRSDILDCLRGRRFKLALDKMKVLRSLRVPLDDADLLRCCASLGRARQLRRAGLRKEAETLLKSAATRAPKLGELRSLPATTVDVWADVGPVSDVLTLAGETPRLLPLAVARAFMEQQVGLVGRLAAGHPLAPYASAMGEAATAMAAGDWDAAAQALRDAPRQSPLGPWRVFSKVMASFLAGDLQAVRRGIATLPDDFAMMPVCRGLIPSEDTSGPNHLARLLHPRLAAKADVAAVVAAGHDGPAARLEAHLAALLSSVGGDDSSAWCSALELLAAMLRKRAGSLKPLLQVAKRKVQAQHPAEGAKLALLAARSPGSSDFWDAVGTYLRALGADFPDVEAQSLAKAHVLEHVARGIDARCTPARFFWTPLARDALAPHLDPTLANGEDWLVGVAAASVRNDPGGFERARFLMELLRDDPVPLTPVLEDTLRAVAEACPHEPGPWLALAHLFYGKRAYRRAEAAIARAAQIAPYDNAALAMQAGSHVVSAMQSAKRRRPALAAEQLEAAKALARPEVTELLHCGELTCRLLSEPNNPAAALAPLSPLPRWQRLRVLTLVRRMRPPPAATRREFLRALAEAEAEVSNYTAEEVQHLLGPVNQDIAELYTDRPAAAYFIPLLGRLLERSDDLRLLDVYDLILSTGDGIEAVADDVRRRLRRGLAANLRLELRLYALALPGLLEESTNLEALQSLVKDASPTEAERLKDAAARLAKWADEPWASALQTLDFAGLRYGGPDCFESYDDDDEGDDAEDFLAPSLLTALKSGSPAMLVQLLELMVDSQDLRNAPEIILRHAAGDLAQSMPAAILQVLIAARPKLWPRASREARELINALAEHFPSHDSPEDRP